MVEIRRLATAYPKREVGREACRVAPDRLIEGARFDAVQTGETRRQDHPLAAQRHDHIFDRCEPAAQRARAHQGCWEMSPDVIVIGAGAIGASAALHLARAGVRVTLLEKEKGPAQHQSGRNSGVIHAGYNLKPGSLKAKYCVEGNRALRQYCRERGIAMEQGGILIVARSDAERATLAELHRRAQANGVRTTRVDERGITEIEPHARGIEALSAPDGASFDAPAYVAALLEDARAAGARVEFGRDAYRLAQVQPRDLLSTLLWPGFYRMMVQPRFRALVRSELLKSLFLGRIAAEARLLIPELEARDLVRSYAGNRAQVVSR